MNRRLFTYVLLCTSLVVVGVAQMSFRRPSLWRWAQVEPAQVAAESETLQSPAANPVPTMSEHPRRAPYPMLTTLAGAADREPFLAPAADALPELQASARATLDAQARYHLLQLARDAVPSALEADARRDIRYQALLQKPDTYRGEVVHIQGDLISLAEPMELHGKLPGIEVCYVGLMTNDRPDHQYLVLFTDLPGGLTPDQTQWKQLYLRNVQFNGYYYKVARFTRQEGKVKSWMLPVLVGKTLLLPAMTAEPTDWVNLLTIFIAMVVPVLLIILLVPPYFARRDKNHESLMQAFRARREARIKESLEQLPAFDDPDLRSPGNA